MHRGSRARSGHRASKIAGHLVSFDCAHVWTMPSVGLLSLSDSAGHFAPCFTAQHNNTNHVNHRMRNGCGDQAEFNEYISHQHGRKKHESAVSPLRTIHRPETTGSIVRECEKQARPPDPQERLQRSPTQNFFTHAGTEIASPIATPQPTCRATLASMTTNCRKHARTPIIFLSGFVGIIAATG
jgi:hypothetical protein